MLNLVERILAKFYGGYTYRLVIHHPLPTGGQQILYRHSDREVAIPQKGEMFGLPEIPTCTLYVTDIRRSVSGRIVVITTYAKGTATPSREEMLHHHRFEVVEQEEFERWFPISSLTLSGCIQE